MEDHPPGPSLLFFIVKFILIYVRVHLMCGLSHDELIIHSSNTFLSTLATLFLRKADRSTAVPLDDEN
jgi:hypothetical protein